MHVHKPSSGQIAQGGRGNRIFLLRMQVSSNKRSLGLKTIILNFHKSSILYCYYDSRVLSRVLLTNLR